MDEKDFLKAIVGAEDMQEIENLFAQVAAEHDAEKAQAAAEAPKPIKDGLWYDADGVDANGHKISWYRLAKQGKTLLWFSVDNDIEVPTAALGKLPAGVTGHAIRAWNATRTESVSTAGIAIRAPHGPDDTHIDGQSVRAYVMRRVTRWVAQFYGV